MSGFHAHPLYQVVSIVETLWDSLPASVRGFSPPTSLPPNDPRLAPGVRAGCGSQRPHRRTGRGRSTGRPVAAVHRRGLEHRPVVVGAGGKWWEGEECLHVCPT